MVRAPYYDKNGVKKGAWSREEDERLIAFIQRCGHFNWRRLPKFAGLERCGKSCRLRWLNYLRPNLKHGNFTQEEEQIIITLHRQFGNKWSKIAEKLAGRTDNEVKNYWHSNLKKTIKRNKEDTNTSSDSNSHTPDNDNNNIQENESQDEFSRSDYSASQLSNGDDVSYHILESSLVTETSSGGDNYSITSSNVSVSDQSNVNYDFSELLKEDNNNVDPISFGEFSANFWTEPFVTEDMYNNNEICSGDGIALMFDSNMDHTFLL